MKLHIKYENSTWKFTPKNYTRGQVKERIKLALVKYVDKDRDFYEEIYGKNSTIPITVSTIVEVEDRWHFKFEENQIIREAIINPRNPIEKPIVTVIEENTEIALVGDEMGFTGKYGVS
ncbi:hypothetical protein [Legionella brunensis]|uniref:Uncharacterized protein n=1 Tax=Legionella brunensis TaxID=29422 RepID=A0A0W0S3I6_9GAMM|nr:hypothetical protein [Legionella brunensis]KTC77866.1 hypothetical protein Lbru_2759 [Legionella brunensis]